MKKYNIYVILLLIIMTLFLTGCIKIDISTGIDENYTAFLTYDIEMDLSNFDERYSDRLKNALNRIGWHYQEELGFTVELDIENNPNKLTMTKRVVNSNFEQAYKSLESLLTNEDMTPFMQVDMAFESSERQNRYIFSAEADISKIIQLTNDEELSPVLQEEFEKAIKTGEGSITLSLPVSEIVSSSHQTDMLYHQAVMSVPLNYTGKTEVELSGVLNRLADGSQAGSLNEITHDLNKFRSLSAIITCAIIVLLLIIFLLIKLSANKRRYK